MSLTTCINIFSANYEAAFRDTNDDEGFCIIDTALGNRGLIDIVTNPDLQSAFPISERFPQLEMYIGL